MADSTGSIGREDRELILALAARLRMTEWAASPGTLVAVGDGETFYELVRDGNDVAFVEVQRGRRSIQARFDSVADAVRFLVFTLADQRSGPEWTPIEHTDFAPGTAYAPVDEDWVLRWPGGRAVSPHRRLPPATARDFSWVATASPADIAASYRHPHGEPLFDLAVTRGTDLKPPTSTLKPRPLESPPPDPEAATETEAVLAVAAEIGMTLRPLGEGDVLAVGWDHAGRVIGYRHGMFQYQSFASDHRTTVATFSTAPAARRFLAMEIGAIARQRRREPGFRVPGPASGFTVTKGPTEFAVAGPGVQATFPLGPVGQQHALTFSYCADAALEDIAVSYLDPAGAPLFTSSR
jgi:hypothetical protein